MLNPASKLSKSIETSHRQRVAKAISGKNFKNLLHLQSGIQSEPTINSVEKRMNKPQPAVKNQFRRPQLPQSDLAGATL